MLRERRLRRQYNAVVADSNLVCVPRFGFGFLGTRFSDAKLIGMAYAFEQRTLSRGRVRPYIVPQTELEDVVV